jgi:hypothetical protein
VCVPGHVLQHLAHNHCTTAAARFRGRPTSPVGRWPRTPPGMGHAGGHPLGLSSSSFRGEEGCSTWSREDNSGHRTLGGTQPACPRHPSASEALPRRLPALPLTKESAGRPRPPGPRAAHLPAAKGSRACPAVLFLIRAVLAPDALPDPAPPGGWGQLP